jgi:hypothetical protein
MIAVIVIAVARNTATAMILRCVAKSAAAIDEFIVASCKLEATISKLVTHILTHINKRTQEYYVVVVFDRKADTAQPRKFKRDTCFDLNQSLPFECC